MKIKKHILTLLLILATVVGYAQTFNYQLNYGSIKFGNSAAGQHQFNGLANFVNGITIPLRVESDSSANAASTQWVKRLVQGLGSPLTFSNGLTKTDNDVKLGGDLSELTYIDHKGFPFAIYGTGLTSPSLGLTSGSIRLGLSNNTTLYKAIRIEENGRGIDVLDNMQNVGFVYSKDFSIGRTFPLDDNWLPNAKYVNDKIASLPSAPVTSVNGRIGAVTGLAEASSLSAYQTIANLSTDLTASATKYPSVNAVNTGLADKASLTLDNIYNSASSWSQKYRKISDGTVFSDIGWDSFKISRGSSYTFYGYNLMAHQTSPGNSLTVAFPSTITGNFTTSFRALQGTVALLEDLTSKANLTGGNNFVGAQNIKGVLSVNPATGTYPFIQIADNGNLTAFESATSQIGINGSTGRLAFTRAGFTGTINNPTLTANRTWDLPNKTGTFALTSDVSALSLQDVTNVGNTIAKAGDALIKYERTGVKGWDAGVRNNGDFVIGDGPEINLVITENGRNVGIGKTPLSRLDVDGSARASANDGNANTLVRNTDLSNYALKTPVFSTSGTSATLVSSGRYIPQNASLTIYTLPTTASVGDVIFINGKGAGGWRISQNTGQVIHGATDTTTGSAGYVASTARYNSIAIVCVTANTEWIIQSSQGSLTIN